VRKSLSLLLSCILAIVSFVAVASLATSAKASPADDYVGPFFGDGNLPPGCIKDRNPANPANQCYHAKVFPNGLDSPIIDVAVLVPASPTAERDLRITRQAMESWEGGIEYLATEMGLDWLAEGVKFHITPSIIGATEGDEVSTYPLYDPEIVVIATNPAGGIGVGIDPVALGEQGDIADEDAVPCHTIQNPFSMETWEGMPGYDGHHGDNGGVYVEDCGGAGGNICYAISPGIDPLPPATDQFSLYELVQHEVGHCLTLGHVGDGADGAWGPVPTHDIMSYSFDPPGLNKCVSTLDVEGFALRMSKYLDVNGDGEVSAADRLVPNDLRGDGSYPMQVQRLQDHHYASSTGSVWDCPQPDLATVPGERTDWTPEPVDTTTPVLTVDTPGRNAGVADGQVQVTGAVERQPKVAPPTSTTASSTDSAGDSTSPLTDIERLDVEVTDLEVTATLKVTQLWPSTEVTSLPKYGIAIDGQEFDSFIPDPRDPAGVKTWDHSYTRAVPSEWSKWDLDANTVTFHIPRSYLADNSQEIAPYDVFAMSGYGAYNKWTMYADDRAPDAGMLAVAGPPMSSGDGTSTDLTTVGGGSTTGSNMQTFVLEREEGNYFSLADTQTGVTDTSHHFTLDVPGTSHVELTLAWEGGSDLDLSVTGAATGSSATAGKPERVVLDDVQGQLDITVNPTLIFTAPGTTYTLTATVDLPPGDSDGDGFADSSDLCPSLAGPAPSGCPDSDGDGVRDGFDACPDEPGTSVEGCPILTNERVRVYVDDVLAAIQDVHARGRRDTFAIPVALTPGTHEVRTEWVEDGQVIATDARAVIFRDGDPGGGNHAPSAAISGVAGGPVDATLAFGSNATDADSDPLTYSWSYVVNGVESPILGTGPDLQHAFHLAGTYTLKVVVDDGTVTTTDTKTVTVTNTAPTAASEITSVGAQTGDEISFDATGSSDLETPDQLTYRWDFGDGSGSDQKVATHTYTTTGTKSVVLTVTDPQGLVDTVITSLAVGANGNPTVVMSVDDDDVHPHTVVHFDSTGSTDAETPNNLSYAWDFGDGATATGASAAHAYAGVGVYIASLTVDDHDGGVTTVTRQITVRARNTAPTVDATVTPGAVWLGKTQVFDATGHDQEGSGALTYRWTFGDGTSAAGSHASHRYTRPGVFTAKVTVTDAGGLTATKAATIHVGKKVSCSNANVVRTGSWRKRSSAAASGDSYCDNLGRGAGKDTLTVRAAGDRIGLSFARGQLGGTARVYVDGIYRGLVTFRSSATRPRFGYSRVFSGLSNTTHTMRIVVTQGQAYVDDVHVWGPVAAPPDRSVRWLG